MFRLRAPLAATLGAALAVSGLTGCGAAGSGSSGGASITLYNGQHEQTTDKLVAAFEAKTGIHVNVRNDDEDVFDNELQTEGSRSPADVIFTENSPALEFLQEHHLLAPLDASTLANTPAKYNSAAGDWVGVSARVSALVYNPAKISASQLPRAALAMADPRYAGKLAIAPGETDFQPVVTSMLKAYGSARALAWLKGLKSNAGSQVYPDNETIVSDVNSGTAAFGLINQYYWYRLADQIGMSKMHSRLAYFAPRDPGYVLDISGAGVLASSRHKAEAQRFVAFLTSQTAQNIIVDSDSFEYPIASGVTRVAAGERPLAALQPNPIDLEQLGDGTAAVALMKQAQLL